MKASVILTLALGLVSQVYLVLSCSSDVQADVVFVVDSGGTTGEKNYHFFFDTIGKVVSKFSVSEDTVRTGLTVQDTKPAINFRLTGNVNLLKTKLKNIKYQYNEVQTQKSLGMAKQLFFLPYPRDPPVPSIIVFFTDGHNAATPDAGTTFANNFLKEEGFIIITIGLVSKASEVEVKNIASKPEYSIIVSSYAALPDQSDQIAALICDAASGN
jgi:hypothetical protein